MLKKIKLLFTSFFLFFIINSNHLYSQTYLELRKATQLKSFLFYPGDNIRFKKKGDDFFTFAKITGIRDQNLRFNNIEVPINQIDIIDIRNKTSDQLKTYGNIIAGGSLAYFIMDFINLSLVQRANYKDVYNKNILISCSVGFSIGAVSRIFKRKYYKRNDLNRIWIQNTQ